MRPGNTSIFSRRRPSTPARSPRSPRPALFAPFFSSPPRRRRMSAPPPAVVGLRRSSPSAAEPAVEPESGHGLPDEPSSCGRHRARYDGRRGGGGQQVATAGTSSRWQRLSRYTCRRTTADLVRHRAVGTQLWITSSSRQQFSSRAVGGTRGLFRQGQRRRRSDPPDGEALLASRAANRLRRRNDHRMRCRGPATSPRWWWPRRSRRHPPGDFSHPFSSPDRPGRHRTAEVSMTLGRGLPRQGLPRLLFSRLTVDTRLSPYRFSRMTNGVWAPFIGSRRASANPSRLEGLRWWRRPVASELAGLPVRQAPVTTTSRCAGSRLTKAMSYPGRTSTSHALGSMHDTVVAGRTGPTFAVIKRARQLDVLRRGPARQAFFSRFGQLVSPRRTSPPCRLHEQAAAA